MNEQLFIDLWHWLYTGMLYGKTAAIYSVVFFVFAIWTFIRWKNIGLSGLWGFLAYMCAYLGGLIRFWNVS